MSLIKRWIGGESGHRSFFGGTVPKSRIVGMGVGVVVFLVLTPFLGVWGLGTGLLICVVTLVATLKTNRGSYLERRTKRARWQDRVQSGRDAFRPYNVAEWDQLQEAAKSATGRKARWAASRDLAAMRANPDGADGMGWLQRSPNMPGIAWHIPNGEDPYLSVAFSVTGQLRGLESDTVLNMASEAWGAFLADRARPTSLVRDVQPLTRVLPPDTALQEFWALNAIDKSAPQAAIDSYSDVLRLTGEGSMVQRHYMVGRWPITTAFKDAAARYAPGREGWRILMKHEIRAFATGLREARLGEVEALTARRSAAVILHMQNPSRPIDYVQGVDATEFGVPSHDELSAHVVHGTDPITDKPVEWWHRTAAIRADHLEVGARNPLWLLGVLTGGAIQSHRTVSFHLKLIPAKEAKRTAKRDLTRDSSELLSDQESGAIVDDETSMNMTAAKRRVRDLGAGTPHHGVEWIGFITISERSRGALSSACRLLADTCSHKLGVEKLEWLDSYQSAASGTTWPIVRGQAPVNASVGTRAMDRLAGREQKEAIS